MSFGCFNHFIIYYLIWYFIDFHDQLSELKTKILKLTLFANRVFCALIGSGGLGNFSSAHASDQQDTHQIYIRGFPFWWAGYFSSPPA